MNWNKLTGISQLDAIDKESADHPVLILKHSKRCNISATALDRLERRLNSPAVIPYLLDVLQYRDVSGEAARRYGVPHESPQALLIRNGQCVYHESHLAISADDIESAAA
jgi:bacillithiol system protein YtxJ